MELNVRTDKKKPTAQERHAIALEHCQRGWHSFRETITQGEQMCLTCGRKAYCPRCLSVNPGTLLKLCATHRVQEGGKNG